MKIRVGTSRANVWLEGRLRPRRPVLLAVSGAFAHPSTFRRLDALYPEASTLVANLPGNHCPAPSDWHPATMAASLDEAMSVLCLSPVVIGSSLGGVVAMMMRTPCEVIALDPSLLNDALGPLEQEFERRLRADPGNADLADFLWAAFGVGANKRELRDFLGQISDVPAVVITGDSPSRRLPSVVSPEARRRLSEMANVRLVRSARAGHDVIYEDGQLVLAESKRALAAQCEAWA